MTYADESDIKALHKDLGQAYPKCQISYRNKELKFYGHIETVTEAKLQALAYIAKLNTKNFSTIEKNLNISKDIQWQFEITPNKWKNFSVYINSLIEAKNSMKESKVWFFGLLFF